jgi:type II secretory pathway component PulM
MTPDRTDSLPAPPPLWQSEPLYRANHKDRAVPPIVWTGISLVIVLTCLILVRHRLNRRRRPQLQEQRLRRSLVARLGPDAVWMSAEALAATLDTHGIGSDDPLRRDVARLHSIERARFGANPPT